MRFPALITALLALTGPCGAEQIDAILPTANHALYDGPGSDFYQFVDRDFEGVKTTPWEGGQYGFVRNPVRTPAGLLFSRLHEGIDIKPIRRDAAGVPLDDVWSVADGRVVHINLLPGASNYGRYVVVEHTWAGCRYYSLYAHLNTITVTPGAVVKKSDKLGVVGFTGAGIDLRRAHLHFELNLMLSSGFDDWHRKYFAADRNVHGLYNGLNLAGLDTARFFKALRAKPALTVPEFIGQQPVFYKVRLPAITLDLVKSYPWLLGKGSGAMQALEVSFDQTGLPLKITPISTAVAALEVSWVKPAAADYGVYTRNILTGRGKTPGLSASGLRYMELLMTSR